MIEHQTEFREDGTRFCRLHSSARYVAELVHHPASKKQQRHNHASAQVSFLLAGCFAENSDGRELEPLGNQMGYKPAGAAHSVRFGQNGALMLAIDLAEDVTNCVRPRQWSAQPNYVRHSLALLARNVAPVGDILDSLIASVGTAEAAPVRHLSDAPDWLRRAIAHIAEDPKAEIAALAAEAGVHRVHFSRSFQRFTGLSPSQFRLHSKCAAATRLMVEGRESTAAAAVAAGFADQAHWNRASRALSGIAPGRIRKLLSA